MSDTKRFWYFMAAFGLLVILMFYAVSAQTFRRSGNEEKEYIYGFFMSSVPVNFLAWSGGDWLRQGTAGYNAVVLISRGSGDLKDVNAIAGAGVGVILGYGEKPVIGLSGVVLISDLNTFCGYDFVSRRVVLGIGYTILFPFPKKAYITIFKREVIE